MKRLRYLYLMIANSLMLAAAVLVILHVVVTVRNRRAPLTFEGLSAAARDSYRHLQPHEVVDLLTATYKPDGNGWSYEAWVGYREAERTSRFINVNKFGIRSNGRSRDDLALLDGGTWFFGGSTTFGYGVTDTETIPAQVEALLGEPVVNLGRGYYYSAQENHLLGRLLMLGHRPRRAIFLDGINERCDIENYQRELSELFRQATFTYSWNAKEIFKPLLYFRDRLLFRLTETGNPPLISEEFACQGYGAKTSLDRILAATLQQRRMICEHFGAECTTFVQPVAGMHGVHEDPAALAPANRDLLERKFRYLAPVWRREGARFIVDALAGLGRHAYVDDVHYSAEASRLIAGRIADEVHGCRTAACGEARRPLPPPPHVAAVAH